MNAHTKAFGEFLSGLAGRPKFTRLLTREEIMALSHQDHLEYIGWVHANSAELFDRKQRGAVHQREFLSEDRDYDKVNSKRNWEYGE